MDKENTVYMYGILLSHKKDEIWLFMTTWVNFDGIILGAKLRWRRTNTI